MRDFTVEAYASLTEALGERYRIVPVEGFVRNASKSDWLVAMRHDVDRRASAALSCAEVMADRGAKGTFYFRYPATFRPEIMRRVASLGHEVGYHYEVLTKTRGDIDRALQLFAEELRRFREVCDIQTVCMHGSPLSPWDNRAIWGKAELADFDLIAEPYLSIDFTNILYLTDTGRTWAGERFSIRDRVLTPLRHDITSTSQLMSALVAGRLPQRIMITIHPERWSADFPSWIGQLLSQTLKNIVKAAIVRGRRRGIEPGSARNDGHFRRSLPVSAILPSNVFHSRTSYTPTS